MIVSALSGILFVLAAAFLGVAEKALGPDINRFPCIGRKMRWVLQIYTVAVFLRAVVILTSLASATPRIVYWDTFVMGIFMCAAHGMLLNAILQQRLPSGLWVRLQARQNRVRHLAQDFGEKGAALATLAAEGVRVIGPGEGPDAVEEVVVLH